MGDWRGGETDVRYLLARLYRSSTNLLADIQFLCADKQPVWAHKLVLALASQYFQDLFYPWSNGHQVSNAQLQLSLFFNDFRTLLFKL